MEKLNGSILITPKEIEVITGKTYDNCRKEHKAIRDALNKQNSPYLTVLEYCNYYGLNPDEIITHLNNHRRQKFYR